MKHSSHYLILIIMSLGITELKCKEVKEIDATVTSSPIPQGTASNHASKPALTKEKLAKTYEIIGISGYGLPPEEEKLFKEHTITCPSTYGEITWESLEELIKHLNIQPNDIFYDLGSGTGKVVLQVACTTPVQKAVGIELAPTRIKAAQEALSTLKKQPAFPEKEVAFNQESFLNAPLHDATIIYMCSTCFSKELMDELVKKIKKETKPGLKIVTFKQLPGDPAFILEKEYSLPTSWSTGSPIYIYILKG